MHNQIVIACDELQRLYESEGMTTTLLGARYGYSATTIAKRLRGCGVTLRSGRYAPRAIPADELRQLYIHEQRTVAAVAQHFGVCASTIYNRCRAYGLPLRKRDAKKQHQAYVKASFEPSP